MSTTKRNDFLVENPYPTYEDMTENWLSSRIDLDAEYGLQNHKLCRKIYMNLNKRIQLREAVEEFISSVNSLGGKQAVKANIETLVKYTPLFYCRDETLLDALRFVMESVEKLF
jgi:hypothetical protein